MLSGPDRPSELSAFICSRCPPGTGKSSVFPQLSSFSPKLPERWPSSQSLNVSVFGLLIEARTCVCTGSLSLWVNNQTPDEFSGQWRVNTGQHGLFICGAVALRERGVDHLFSNSLQGTG